MKKSWSHCFELRILILGSAIGFSAKPFHCSVIGALTPPTFRKQGDSKWITKSLHQTYQEKLLTRSTLMISQTLRYASFADKRSSRLRTRRWVRSWASEEWKMRGWCNRSSEIAVWSLNGRSWASVRVDDSEKGWEKKCAALLKMEEASITPTLHRSAFVETKPDLIKRGSTYGRVPAQPIGSESKSSDSTRPKSIKKILRCLPDSVRRIFEGLMSRWAYFWSWRTDRVKNNCFSTLSHVCHDWG